jgi:hypothetical protein
MPLAKLETGVIHALRGDPRRDASAGLSARIQKTSY